MVADRPDDLGDPSPDAPATRRSGGFGALHSPGYRIYFAGMLLRGAAMWMPLVAIPWIAVERGATPAEVGAIVAVFYLPTLFIGALSGVLADRVERRTVLVAAQFAAAVLSGLVFLLIVSDTATLATLGLAMIGFGALLSIEVPVRQAFMIELVPRSEIASAASLHAMAWNITRLFGPVLAGLLIATLGSASPFVITMTASAVVAMSYIWMDRYRDAARHRPNTDLSVAAALREGLRFALGEPTVRWSMIIIAVMAALGLSTFVTLAPIFATEQLNVAADGFGGFLGASGAGAVTAAVFVTVFINGDRRPFLVAGIAVMGALMAILAMTESLALAYAVAFLLGASQIMIAQNALISVQQSTPDDRRGRVMGLWVMVFQGSSLFGAIAAGWVAELAGVRNGFLVSGVALLIVAVVAGFALRRVTWRSVPAPQPTC